MMKIEKLIPVCKDYLWGGSRLKEIYGKPCDGEICAESWELSFHPDGKTMLLDGRTLAEAVSEEELGENVKGFPLFPVLIKFIDAKSNLSVQVHPSDEYALKNENSFGKTEMWYIVEADEGAGIYLGFSRDVSEDEMKDAIAEHRLTELLNFYPVKAGQCYFIPAGTIHAIGAGCLICEIQQNSNLTYRVYDYGRRDKDGKERELHVDKAMLVTDRRRYEATPSLGEVLGVSKYFHSERILVDGEHSLNAAEKSFHCLTCVAGEGSVGELSVKLGDSIFVPSGFGEYQIKGEMTMILTDVRKYYLGIDLGGTFIKGGIVDDEGNILVRDKVPTESDKGGDAVVENIVSLCRSLMAKTGLSASDLVGVGMGLPGTVDGERGEVVYANNLGWEHFLVSEKITEALGLPVMIENDANVAALGEAKFGCGKDYRYSVMVTLGTGVGGGMVFDGKLFAGNRSAGGELGHIVVASGGEPCTCGRRGCLEAYASATALIRDTKRAMENHPESKLWEVGSLDAVTGKTAFDYWETDAVAKEVVDRYLTMLGEGIVNIANLLRPEIIILGGGVCAEGERMLRPLREMLQRDVYGGDSGPEVKLTTATLGNDAGLLGAAALLM